MLSSAEACTLPADEVLRHLGVDALQGLSLAQVQERQRQHGPNELPSEEEAPLWKKFLGKLKEPMIALLLGSAVVSLLVGSYDDAVSITLVRPAAVGEHPLVRRCCSWAFSAPSCAWRCQRLPSSAHNSAALSACLPAPLPLSPPPSAGCAHCSHSRLCPRVQVRPEPGSAVKAGAPSVSLSLERARALLCCPLS
jgi:hypothetical protein